MPDDLELETFLRQFRPVAPPPLRRPRTTPGWCMPAAIAASVVLALVAVRPSVRSPKGPAEEPPRRATLGALGHAVRTGTYESALDALDARVLPDPTREGGALRTLADVSRDWRR